MKRWHEESRRLATHQPNLPSRHLTADAIAAVREWLAAGHTEVQMRALIDFANADRKWHYQLSGNLTYIARNWDRILDDLGKRGTPEQKRAFAAPVRNERPDSPMLSADAFERQTVERARRAEEAVRRSREEPGNGDS